VNTVDTEQPRRADSTIAFDNPFITGQNR